MPRDAAADLDATFRAFVDSLWELAVAESEEKRQGVAHLQQCVVEAIRATIAAVGVKRRAGGPSDYGVKGYRTPVRQRRETRVHHAKWDEGPE